MPSRMDAGVEWVARNSPTMSRQAFLISSSRNRSPRPRAAMTRPNGSAITFAEFRVRGDSGTPRHSAITRARSLGSMGSEPVLGAVLADRFHRAAFHRLTAELHFLIVLRLL